MYVRKNPYILLRDYAQKTAQIVRNSMPGRYSITNSEDTGLSENPNVSHTEVSLVMGPGRLFGNLWLRPLVRLTYHVQKNGRPIAEIEVKSYDRKVDLKRLEVALENMTLTGPKN